MLKGVAGVGQLNSRGEFTLDVSRASLLLERYQLPSPAYFMLHALGAAVASGASSVEMTARGDLFQLIFDGEPFSPEEASECVASLWLDGGRPEVLRLQELAIARGGAMQWGAKEFTLERLASGLQRLRVLRGGWLKRLQGAFQSEELQALRDHLVSTPTCEVSLNGKPLPSLTYPRDLAQAFALGESSLPLLASLPNGTPSQCLTGYPEFDGVGLLCQLPGIVRLPEWAPMKSRRSFWPGFMDVILNARLYRCPLPPGWNGWWGVFYLGSLRRDLSFSYLAEADVERLRSLFSLARESGSSPATGGSRAGED